ncbi:hypothetical protein jhhlp_006589 [Lomentospora prolificans]|uniref:Ubiquitin-conjugating enzyme E2 2 n=1 Tax=Lomentospora prolificans TaxID=41688 RepID=A0A2N3N6E0_9PEZI|nr:hypothetical protein jhhlp_006589 [Lomentospora prolificans]
MAEKRLMSELQALQKEKWVHIDVNEANIKKWTVGLMVVNPDSVFSGGYFKRLSGALYLTRPINFCLLQADMTFPSDYPYRPPTFRFQKPVIYHPNVYTDGRLCISILHAPGEDEMSGEQASERWSPLQGAESVLRSVLLLLDTPEINSPANVDASVTYRDQRDQYDTRARQMAEQSRKNIPAGVVFPTTEDLAAPPTKSGLDDDDFMNESDEESIGGSDSDMDDFDEDFEEEEEEDE